MDIVKRAEKLVERRLMQHNAINKAVREARGESAFYRSSCIHSIGGKGNISRPTEKAALKKILPIPSIEIPTGKKETETVYRPEDWLKVYNFTIAKGGEVAKRRYDGEYFQKTCMDLFMCSKNYYDHRKEFLQWALCYALQLHLVKVIDWEGICYEKGFAAALRREGKKDKSVS